MLLSNQRRQRNINHCNFLKKAFFLFVFYKIALIAKSMQYKGILIYIILFMQVCAAFALQLFINIPVLSNARRR